MRRRSSRPSTSPKTAESAPAAAKAAATAPTEVPATRGNDQPASSRPMTAPAVPRPFTPPPSRTRSARSSAVTSSTLADPAGPRAEGRVARAERERLVEHGERFLLPPREVQAPGEQGQRRPGAPQLGV